MIVTENIIRNRWAFLLGMALVQQAARIRWILAERRRRRTYRSDLQRLLSVGEHMIRDIGLTLDDALREIEKPVGQP